MTEQHISDVRSLDLQRRQAEARAPVGALALEVLHEVQTPLETLNNLLYLILERAAEPEFIREYANMAEAQLLRINRPVQEVLQIAGRTTASPTDLVGLANVALNLHEKSVEAKRIHLVRELPQAVTVDMQHGPMLQAMSNLIFHTLESIPERGTLTVSIRKQANGVQFLLADTSNGDGAEARGKAAPLVEADDLVELHPRLTVSRRIIQEHKGTLQLRAPYASKGSPLIAVSLPHHAAGQREA